MTNQQQVPDGDDRTIWNRVAKIAKAGSGFLLACATLINALQGCNPL